MEGDVETTNNLVMLCVTPKGGSVASHFEHHVFEFCANARQKVLKTVIGTLTVKHSPVGVNVTGA